MVPERSIPITDQSKAGSRACKPKQPLSTKNCRVRHIDPRARSYGKENTYKDPFRDYKNSSYHGVRPDKDSKCLTRSEETGQWTCLRAFPGDI